MVNLELYRVFYTVAKCGSLTKAADQLFISQPAVSQAIKQLETQLGGKLFNRQSRGMELTDPAGKRMFEIVSEIIEKLINRGYVVREKKNILITEKGKYLVDCIIAYFSEKTNYFKKKTKKV